MRQNIIRNILLKIEKYREIRLEKPEEKRFFKLYEGKLFRTIIPASNSYAGIYKLTLEGEEIIQNSSN